MKLEHYFYQRNALEVARDLIGKKLVRTLNNQVITGRIVETEAYVGPEDKGCHAFNNKRTARTDAMFLPGGVAYIYLIYGMYNCFNVVAGQLDKPEAVLIRALEPLDNLELIKINRKTVVRKVENLTNGPGKLCQAYKIDRGLNKYDLVEGKELYLVDSGYRGEIASGPRINIDYAGEYKDKPWRFYLKGSSFLSR
ncbi:MAG: DNA-3-methyladenine glycosylase [Deltaproteobacteria bacterium]|nr:DNA-3-methyladenine glycosylase [Deltaproteobacteria bacterium]